MKTNSLSPVMTLTVNGSGRTIEVRELRWRDYTHVVKMLTGTILKIVGGGKDKIVATREEIVEAISTQEELIAWMISKSTSLTESEISELSARDVIPIISAMVELNLSEEVTGPGKNLAGQLGRLFGLKIASVKPSTTSSPMDTGSGTSSS